MPSHRQRRMSGSDNAMESRGFRSMVMEYHCDIMPAHRKTTAYQDITGPSGTDTAGVKWRGVPLPFQVSRHE